MRHAPHAAAAALCAPRPASQAEGPELEIWEEEDGRGGKRQPADQAGAGPAASKASSRDDGLNKQVARIEKPQAASHD